MTQSTASFIDQLEAAALGKKIPMPNPVAKHAPKFNKPATHKDKKKASKKGEVKHKKDIYDEVEPTAYTGSVEGALNDLSTLFENAFNVTLEEPETQLEPISASVDEMIPFIEPDILSEEIKPTISPEAVENATSELMDLFEIMAGVDLTTGEKIEEPVTEEVIEIPVPLPTTYSAILDGSRSLNDVVVIPKAQPTLLEKQNAASDILMRDWKGDLEGSKNAKANRVITDVTELLDRHRNEMPEEEYKILESDAVEKTVKYINDLQLDEAETYTNTQSMPFTGANMPLVSGPQFTFAVGNILRKMMATGPGSGVAEVAKLVDIDESTLTDGYTLQYKPNVAPTKYPFKWVDPSSGVGDITGVIAGTGLSGGGLTGTVTLNIDVTELTALGAQPVAADTFLIYDADAATLKKVTYSNLIPTTHGDVAGPGSSTDDALAKYDGTTGKTIQNSNATLTDAGTLTATAFSGPLTGNVTGNASGTAATVTGATQASITTAANLVTVGTIGTGVWQGTAVANAYLGTGINSTKLADGSVTNTELQYINTLSSNAQTQITAKAGKSFVTAMAVALG